MRPVLEGLVLYDAVFAKPPVLDISDIARMNDHLDVKQENEYRIRRAYEEHIAAQRSR